MNAYLQRADDFIQQQIYKCEQKLNGRDYAQMNASQTPQYNHGQRAQTFNTMPAQGPPAPKGWSQEFDQQSQRWFYLEHASGRSQWEPPSMFEHRRGHSNTFSEHHPPPGYRNSQENYGRGRSSTQSSRPQSGHLGVPQQQQRPNSASPHPSVTGQLPPGSYYDTKTGQVVSNMFPPDHPMNQR
jgi:hypothetical protein